MTDWAPGERYLPPTSITMPGCSSLLHLSHMSGKHLLRLQVEWASWLNCASVYQGWIMAVVTAAWQACDNSVGPGMPFPRGPHRSEDPPAVGITVAAAAVTAAFMALPSGGSATGGFKQYM